MLSHGYAWNRLERGALPGNGGEPLWEVWGEYAHGFTLTSGGWKVDAMTFTMTAERGDGERRRAGRLTPLRPKPRGVAPARPPLASQHGRHALGVVPASRRKCSAKRLPSSWPAWNATSTTGGRVVRSRTLACSIRRPMPKRSAECPVAARNARGTCASLIPAAPAMSPTERWSASRSSAASASRASRGSRAPACASPL